MIPFLKQHLAPNRIAVYLVAIVALAGALAPLLADLNLQQVGAIVAGVGAFAGVIARWLSGWQNYEKAVYTDNLQQRHLEREAAAKAEFDAATQTQQRKPGSGLKLPR